MQNSKANLEISLKKPTLTLHSFAPEQCWEEECAGDDWNWLLHRTCWLYTRSQLMRGTHLTVFLFKLSNHPEFLCNVLHSVTILNSVPITKRQTRGVTVDKSFITDEVGMGNIQILWLRHNLSFSGCALNDVYFLTFLKSTRERNRVEGERKKRVKRRERPDALLQTSLNSTWEWQPFVLLNWIQKVWLTAALLKARAWLTIRRLRNETEAKLGETEYVWVCVSL